jgi:hypothetical protein
MLSFLRDKWNAEVEPTLADFDVASDRLSRFSTNV